jgi:hypothetical protein
MQYKVLVITTGSGSCCKSAPPLNDEVEKACNQMSQQGWQLVTAYPETIRVCKGCNSEIRRASFLIFSK